MADAPMPDALALAATAVATSPLAASVAAALTTPAWYVWRGPKNNLVLSRGTVPTTCGVSF